MKAQNILLILLLFLSSIHSQNIEIQNGETLELKSDLIYITYNFSIPTEATISTAFILYKCKSISISKFFIIEDDEQKECLNNPNYFTVYSLTSVSNKTITFNISFSNVATAKFTLLDLSKEINIDFNQFLFLMSSFFVLQFYTDPIYSANFNIKEINTDQIFYFIEVMTVYYSYYQPVGNGIIEYCVDDNCLNDIYNSSKVIHFNKGSKYKVRYNHVKYLYFDLFLYYGLDGVNLSKPQEIKQGIYSYTIDKSNPYNLYLIDKGNIKSFYINSESYGYIQYSFITKNMIENFPDSLNKMEFQLGMNLLQVNIRTDADYALIIFKDNVELDKNIFFIFDNLITLSEPFNKITITKNSYYFIHIANTLGNYFSSVESNKPSLRLFSIEDNSTYSQITNKDKIIVYNENEDIEIKMRYYFLENDFNSIKSSNEDKLENYLNDYGNQDSLFFRLDSNTFSIYNFFTYLFFDLNSEYYFYYNKIFGDIDIYKTQIDDSMNLQKYLGIIKSYKYEDNFELINDKLSIITGSQLISTFLNYGTLGDIYIQKVEDDLNIKLNKNDITGNLVKLLKKEKLYNLDFYANHLVKLHKDFSDAVIEIYNNNGEIIDYLNSIQKVIELNGENIKIKSNVNSLIYFYSKIPEEKKLHEIIFPKEQKEMNMYFSITNKQSDNEFIYIIKDYSFENHYPMLNSSNWIKIILPKTYSTKIYIDNPYDKLKENFLEEKEYFIIYIANAFDEEGKPYFEEDKFEFGEINFNRNSLNKNNKFNFQVVQMDKDSSIVLSQKNKNRIHLQMIYCDIKSFDYNIDIDYSNYNNSYYTAIINKNDTLINEISDNEIMNIKFYTDSENLEKIIFYYGLTNNKEINNNFLSDSNNINISNIIALDEKSLLIRFNTNNQGYYKFYIIISLLDDNNNLNSFNQACYLTQLITEGFNLNYSLEIITVYVNASDNIFSKFDISNLNIDINNIFVTNIIYEELNNKILGFGSALEFTPDKVQEIFLYKKYNFNNDNNKDKKIFIYNYNDESFNEFIIAIKNDYGEGIINIEGPGLSLYETLDNEQMHEVYFNITKNDFINIEFIDFSGKVEFILFPINRIINIIEFNDKNYFFEYNLFSKNNILIFIYNIAPLKEDKTIYFNCDSCKGQFEICEISSQRCNLVERFFKILANKNYVIHVYTFREDASYQETILKQYIFGDFNKNNIQIYDNFDIEQGNEPYIYSIPKIFDKFYLVNINTNCLYFSENELSNIDDIYSALPNMNFEALSNKNKYFELNYQTNSKQILVFPKFNFELKSYENYTIGFSNRLFVNYGSNININIHSNENGFIILDEDDTLNRNPLLGDYNSLQMVQSDKENLRLIDLENIYNQLQKTLVLNSIDNHSEFIYLEKDSSDYNVEFLYYEPRYAYFYALNDINLKSQITKLKEKRFNSYFERINSNSNNFYDYFNFITFNLEEKINIYIKKYYGYSNLYEINNNIYDIDNAISFIDKPIKTYENEISILNRLFTLNNNELYSGYLDHETLFDIYIDIDDENNEVTLQKENNKYNNLIKLFKPNIVYNLDFEVNHLIKLDSNFDAEITIINNEKTIIINKKNPITEEIKGNNFQIKTDSNAFVYFYSPLINKELFQYELELLNDKNLVIDIEFKENNNCDIYYLIDFGFKGYSPFLFKDSDFNYIECPSKCKLFVQNYFANLSTNLVQGEKLFLYYYIDKCNYPDKKEINFKSIYYSSFGQIDKENDFFIIEPKTEEKEEKNLIFNFYNKDKISFQVHYCLNHEGDNPPISFGKLDDIKETKQFNNSEIFVLDGSNYDIYELTFNSNSNFVLSYSLYDKEDDAIKKYSKWLNERKINYNFNINARINIKEKILTVDFYPNYFNSATKYFIIIGPTNDILTVDKFNDPCFLIKLIKEKSNKVKIYELISMGEELTIYSNIDISDLMSQSENKQEYIVNIISKELRYDKSLNFYQARLVKNESELYIQINEDIRFITDSKYKLEYLRPEQNNQICFIMAKSNSNINPYKFIIQNQNMENISYIIEDKIIFINFECIYDGIYYINIISLSDSPASGIFKIFSSGISFNLDIIDYFNFNFDFNINYQPSILNYSIDTSNLLQDEFVLFNYSNIKIKVENDNNNYNSIEQFFSFQKNQKYNFINEFLEFNGENKHNINYHFEIQSSIKYTVENLIIGEHNFKDVNYSFIKIDFTQTPVIGIETTQENLKFYLSYISETNYNSFPEKISQIKFKEIPGLIISKPNNYEFAILLISFEPNYNPNSIEFIDKFRYLDIVLDNSYYINYENTLYSFKFNSTKESEIIMLSYNFTQEFNGKIFVQSNDTFKTESILDEIKGKVYFDLYPYTECILHFINMNKDNNKGEFKLIKFTGNDNYIIDIKKENIEFNGIESTKETSPLIISFSFLKGNYIKKFVTDKKDLSQFISIKKNYRIFTPINSNYYNFEKNNKYLIQINTTLGYKNKYLINAFKLIGISENGIEYLNKSKNITYNEINTDKFILLDLNKYTKINITLISNSSILNKANINENQYNKFPKEIQNIQFEKIENSIIEIKKENNDNYMILLINLKDHLANIEITLINDEDNNGEKDDGLSTLNITLVSVSCAIFIIIFLVLYIIIRKKIAKNNEIKLQSLQSELIEMNKSDVEQN